MKKMKRFVSILLTVIMMLSMATSAFAENYTITGPGTSDDGNTHTYKIFQIFTGDYANGILSNVKWGVNGKETTGEAVSDTILTELAGIDVNAPDAEKLETIKKYVGEIEDENAYKTINNDPEDDQENDYCSTVTVPAGYYLIKDQTSSVSSEEYDFYTLYIVEVVGNITISPKGDVPEVEKKIKETATDSEGKEIVTSSDVSEASIGDEVSYEITGTLPTNFADYKEYYYLFTDTLSKGLTYKEDSIVVKVNDVNVTEYFYKGVVENSETGVTTIKVGIQDLKRLNNLNGVEINKDTKIVLTYTATINENAEIAGDGNKNEVILDFYNDPNNSGDGSTTPPPENPDEPEPTHPTGEAPKDEVFTYTTELTITKTDENGSILTGAEFILTGSGVNKVLVVVADEFVQDENGEYWKLKNGTYTTEAPVTEGETKNDEDYDSTETKYKKNTTSTLKDSNQEGVTVAGTVGDDGKVTFRGLGAGEYTITESKTPAGYNTIAPITFTIGFDANDKTFTSNNNDITVGADNKLTTTIENKSGSTLPTTGGMGTTMFYIIGSILAIGAAVLLITKKRMAAGNKQ